MILFQCVEFVATFWECLLGICFTARILGEGKNKWKNSLVAALIVAILAWLMAQYQLFSLYTSFVGIGGIAVSACVVYKLKLKDTIIASVAYLLVVYITDFLSVSILGILLSEAQFGKVITEDFSLARVEFILLGKFLLLAVCLFIAKINTDKKGIQIRKIWLGLLVLGIIVCFFGQMTFFETNVLILSIWIFIISLVLITAYSCVQYADNKMKHYQMELTVKNYENLIRNYRDTQIYNHDLKNHYLVIKRYLQTENYENAKKYVHMLEELENSNAPKILTGIESLDSLLECKRKEAEEKKIYISIMADHLKMKMEECDTIALLGNALDNAIEACMNIENDLRWIRVSFRQIGEMVFIKISNSYKIEPVVQEDHIISKKHSEGKFGWGIMSMKMLVEKYDGTINIQYEKGQFDVLISLFF